jgi:glycyl-tRNA synthetase alpha chain
MADTANTSAEPLSVQDMILALHAYWGAKGCLILQPYDMRMGAGTFHPATTLRALGPQPWNAAYVQPSRRPTDGRYGENPNRLQHYYQYQVIMKPSPPEPAGALSRQPRRDRHRPVARTISASWRTTGNRPTLGAWGLGWKSGATAWKSPSSPISSRWAASIASRLRGELTYGLERLAMYIQGVDNVYDLKFNDHGVSYGDVFLENERQMSTWNFEVADTETLFEGFRRAEAECRKALDAGRPHRAPTSRRSRRATCSTCSRPRRDLGAGTRELHGPGARSRARLVRGLHGEVPPRMGSEVPGVDGMSTADFLLELRSEEIPARMQAARAPISKSCSAARWKQRALPSAR